MTPGLKVVINYKKHLENVIDSILHKNGLSFLLVFSPSNIFYVTGSDAPSALVISQNGEVSALVTRLEYVRAVSEMRLGEAYAFTKQDEVSEYEKIIRGDLYEAIAQIVGSSEKIGIVGGSLELKDQLKGKLNRELADYTKEFYLLRRSKDDEEVRLMEQASRIAEQALRKAIDLIEPGVTESELAGEILKVIVSSGAEPSFPPIVAFGEHSAHPHAKPSLKKLMRGDLVKIDLGAKYQGYCSDMTRTFVYGNPSEKQKKIYRAVLRAQEASIDAVKEGAKAKDIHMIAYNVLKEEGLSAYFNHGLGHGVGIDIHEEPYLNSQSETELIVGDVVTIEPGVYLAGYGGVRIEDMLLVQRGTSRTLTFFTKDIAL
jgi:Xaa-Pro aminopeptidase